MADFKFAVSNRRVSSRGKLRFNFPSSGSWIGRL